jgi:hypothetical protein
MTDRESEHVEGLYREGGRLVIREGAEFPDRCVICNDRCDGQTRDFVFKREKKAAYIEVALVQTIATAASDLFKGAKYTGPIEATIPLCHVHIQRKMRRVLIGIGVMALAAVYLLVSYLTNGAKIFSLRDLCLDTVGAVFVAIFGLGILLDATYDPTKVWFKIKKFYDRHVWVEGAGNEFLGTLPLLGYDVKDAGPHLGERPATRVKAAGRSASKARDPAQHNGTPRGGGDPGNLSADELIRRARLAGVDDDDDD